MSEVRTISNSEVSTYLSCERRHYYAHILNLEPKNYATALYRGLIGHEALAVYYSAIREGKGHVRAINEADKVIGNILNTAPPHSIEMLINTMGLLHQYWEWTEADLRNWEILEVEKLIVVPLTDNYNYGMRLDLLVKIIHGEYLGETIVTDHKFMYNFWSQDEINLNSQLPKYIAAVNYEGKYHVDRGMFNQLRHRVLKKSSIPSDERYKRHFYRPSNSKIRNIFKEQILGSERIIQRYEMDSETIEANSLRTLNPMTCRMCPFKMPCEVELSGENASLMFQVEFNQNTYNENYRGLVIEDAE